MVRVRFAPSPTGHLHIGGVRTALFNWLFARHHQGKFILRIEDTDIKRSSEGYTKVILDGLVWLGLNWDEGPYYQSQRLPIYQEYTERLLSKDQAYQCYCTPQELEERRRRMLDERKNPVYDRTCRDLSSQKKERYEDEGRSYTIRFKTPNGITVMEDFIRGRREFDNSLIGDFILIKSSGHPSYNFACVVDDIAMEITHIIRGDDHISNTPRQLLLYEALEAKPPQFAHLPMIWGVDRTRLSKRHGATSLEEYKREGYLPQTLINYLALLGWGTPDSQQIFTIEEMTSKFSLERVSRNPAIFDPEKLLWMNGQYIMKEEIGQLFEVIKPYLVRYQTQLKIRGEEWLKRLIRLYQPRMKTFNEFAKMIDFFFEDIQIGNEVQELLEEEAVSGLLKMVRDRLGKIAPFESVLIER
ncbi:TPA: glutamate--tRNA ligase, partial [bacterium]|nr:glutamate--tRNA ligase [bacterium]